MLDPSATLYETLEEIHRRPEPFERYTARDLWDDEHTSARMLAHHLDEGSQPASRPRAFIDRSAAWIIDRFSLAPGRRVADFGCGPGLYTSRFAATGATTTGIDFSRRSIAHARRDAEERGLDVAYVLADYLEHRPGGRFDLITLIYCDLCPLSPDQRRILLDRFRDALDDDGAVLLDVFSLRAYARRTEGTRCERGLMDGFWAPGDYWGIATTFKYDDARVVLDRYAIVEPTRTRVVDNWLQHFSLDDLARRARAERPAHRGDLRRRGRCRAHRGRRGHRRDRDQALNGFSVPIRKGPTSTVNFGRG